MRIAHAFRCLASAVLAVPLSGALVAAHAQIYTCQTKSGHTMSSDQPIPECANMPMIERQRTGVSRVIPAPLTAEQRGRLEAEQHQKKLAEFAAREQQRKDAALLSSYSSVMEIEMARQRVIGDSKHALDMAEQRIADLYKDRDATVRETKKFGDLAIPATLKRQLDQIDAALDIEEKNRAGGQSEIDRINQKYDAEKKRFIELTKPKS